MPGKFSFVAVRPILRALLIASLLILTVMVTSEWMQRPTPPGVVPLSEPGASDNLIVPGHRVDFITLGLSITLIEKTMGKGTIRPTKEAQLYLFQDYGISMSVIEDRVDSIYVKSPHFKTRQGIAVESDVSQVVRHFGNGYVMDGDEKEYELHYWTEGIHFRIIQERVHAIQITQRVDD